MAGYLVCDLFSGYILSAHLYVLFGLAASAHRIALSRAEAAEAEKRMAVAGGTAPAWVGRGNAA
jgi:hypothetical protein